MSKNERVHFKIALPTDLKQSLEHAAVDNRRSLSAEIIHRLSKTVDNDKGLFGLREAIPVQDRPYGIDIPPDKHDLIEALIRAVISDGPKEKS
jgi:hypothetical protein